MKKSKNLKQITKSLSRTLSTLDAQKPTYMGEWVSSSAGGLYYPDCVEDQMSQADWDDCLKNYRSLGYISIQKGRRKKLETPSFRLYYDIYKKFTASEIIDFELSGSGIVKIDIFAESDTAERIIFSETIKLNTEGDTYQCTSIDVLPDGGSLTVSITAINENVKLEDFRWITRTRKNLVKPNIRIILVRTFGNRGAVSITLNRAIEKLTKIAPEIARRTLFVVYDCSKDQILDETLKPDISGNVFEIKGPNLGGGGNASLLCSIIKAAANEAKVSLEEVVICDDDAQFDAEALIRNDAFILSRNIDCINTALVCSQTNPSVVQEAGGIWGRFFDKRSSALRVDKKDDSKSSVPYLVKATRNLSDKHNWKYMGSFLEIDFSTFIFISIPFSFIDVHGGPKQFFLRNDDVELCLRAQKAGVRTIVNPSIRVWHQTAHNANGEFFSTLHGLIINDVAREAENSEAIIELSRSVTALATVGNILFLSAIEAALRIYANGPTWFDPDKFPNYYLEEMKKIGKNANKHKTQIPLEVVEILTQKNQLEVVNLLERHPRATSGTEIVFANGSDNSYWSYSSSLTLEECIKMMHRSFIHISKIIEKGEEISNSWAKFLQEDLQKFWNIRFSQNRNEFEIAQEKYLTEEHYSREPRQYKAPQAPDRLNTDIMEIIVEISKNPLEKESREAVIPSNFDRERYLTLNPDVKAAGADPEEHYINFGHQEGRQF